MARHPYTQPGLYDEADYLRQAEEQVGNNDEGGTEQEGSDDGEGGESGQQGTCFIEVVPPPGRGPTRFAIVLAGRAQPPTYEDEHEASEAFKDLLASERYYLRAAERSRDVVYDAGGGVVVVAVSSPDGSPTRYVVLVNGKARLPSYGDNYAACRAADRISALRTNDGGTGLPGIR